MLLVRFCVVCWCGFGSVLCWWWCLVCCLDGWVVSGLCGVVGFRFVGLCWFGCFWLFGCLVFWFVFIVCGCWGFCGLWCRFWWLLLGFGWCFFVCVLWRWCLCGWLLSWLLWWWWFCVLGDGVVCVWCIFCVVVWGSSVLVFWIGRDFLVCLIWVVVGIVWFCCMIVVWRVLVGLGFGCVFCVWLVLCCWVGFLFGGWVGFCFLVCGWSVLLSWCVWLIGVLLV